MPPAPGEGAPREKAPYTPIPHPFEENDQRDHFPLPEPEAWIQQVFNNQPAQAATAVTPPAGQGPPLPQQQQQQQRHQQQPREEETGEPRQPSAADSEWRDAPVPPSPDGASFGGDMPSDMVSADFRSAVDALNDMSDLAGVENEHEDSVDMLLMRADAGGVAFELGSTPVNQARPADVRPEETPQTREQRRQREDHEIALAQLRDAQFFETRAATPAAHHEQHTPVVLYDPANLALPTPTPTQQHTQPVGPGSGGSAGSQVHPGAAAFGSSAGPSGFGFGGFGAGMSAIGSTGTGSSSHQGSSVSAARLGTLIPPRHHGGGDGDDKSGTHRAFSTGSSSTGGLSGGGQGGHGHRH